MPELFHFTMLRLGPDSIIQPGNWGRLMKRYQHAGNGQLFGNPWGLCRELVLELVRKDIAPEKPSRFEATFCFESEADARAYRLNHDANFQQVLHKVEIVDPTLPQHRGSLDMLKWPPSGPFLDPMRIQAVSYWRGEGGGIFEIVTASPLRVLACLE